MSANRADQNEILAAERAINEQYRTKVGQELAETARVVAVFALFLGLALAYG